MIFIPLISKQAEQNWLWQKSFSSNGQLSFFFFFFLEWHIFGFKKTTHLCAFVHLSEGNYMPLNLSTTMDKKKMIVKRYPDSSNEEKQTEQKKKKQKQKSL